MAATSTRDPTSTAVSQAAEAEPVKVIYVMGAGHSGSTILGIALGNCAGLFYAGEVDEWLICSGVPPIGGTARTRFWSVVRSQVKGAEDLFGGEVNRSLERSSALFRVDKWAARLRLRGRYRRVTEDLYRAISHAAAGADVVDSSHFPLRARELKRLGGIDVCLLFLVRDPQSVVASELRGIQRHEVAERRLRTLVINANLWLTHLLSVLVFFTHPAQRRLFLRHEDFLADPETVLRQILDRFELSCPIPDLASLATGSPLLANKIIRQEKLALGASETLPPRSSCTTAVLQSPWAHLLSRLRPAATPRKS